VRLPPLLALLAAGLAACGEPDGEPDAPAITSVVDTWRWYVPPPMTVDILFVVDNSASMAAEQARLAAQLPIFAEVMESFDKGMPDVHIGFATADVGVAGQPGVPGCVGDGDDGELLVPAGCPAFDAAFVADASDERGGRVRNYTGDLGDLLACMAQIGSDGCGFPMPLEAMRRALEPGRNPGFRRPGAHLAVFFVTDKDDCSTREGAMFGDPTADLASPLGPFGLFRCHEFGVQCEGDGDPRAFGTRTGCRPRAQSTYMIDVEPYVAFLKSLEPDPSLVIVSGILGVDDEAHTVVVGPSPADPQHPAVQRSCIDPDVADVGAAPAIRLASFIRRFVNRDTTVSICARSWVDVLRHLAARIPLALGRPCLRRPLTDIDPLQGGVQPECSVSVTSTRPADAGRETVLRRCAVPGADSACWELVPDPLACPEAPDHLAIDVKPDGPNGVTGNFRAQCVVR
jgi:hypothetical protein